MKPGERRVGPVLDIVLPLAAVVVRAVAMGLSAAVLTIALGMASDAVLSSPGSLGQSFDRLGVSLVAGLVLGTALGGVLSHRFGHGTYLPVERVGFAVLAAVPFLILAGVIAVGW